MSSDLSYSDAPKPLTQRERDLVKRIFSDWFEVPGEWKGSLRSYLESDPPVLGKAALGASAPSYGTALPTSPTSGQEAVLVDNVAAPTWQWRFRWNALSTSPYKWEFIGGPPMIMSGGGVGGMTATSPTDIAGPGMTVPRAGVYRYLFGANIYNGGTFGGAYMTLLQVYAGGAGIGAQSGVQYHGATYDGAAICGPPSEVTLAAGAVLTIRAWLDRVGSTSNIGPGWINLVPVRVA